MSEGGRRRQQQPPLEINVQRWNEESFTIEGQRPELQEQLRPGRRIPDILLISNNGDLRHFRNVFITRIEIAFHRSAQTTQGSMGFVDTTFWFEQLR
jgi:hypothetical protein